MISYNNKKQVRLKKLKLRRKKSPRKLWWILGLVLLSVCGYFFFFLPTNSSTSEANILPKPKDSLELSPKEVVEPTSVFRTEEKEVEAGDNLVSILGEYLSLAQIYELAKQSKAIYPLEELKVGNKYKLIFESDKLKGFDYEIDTENIISVFFKDSGFDINKKKIHYEIKRTLLSATIKESLFLTIKELGESPALAISLANIFGWDIDFIRDIWPGDSFVVLVEKKYRGKQFAGYGKILAAKFINQGKPFYAFYYKFKGREDYFDLEGRSLRKAFLKAPLSFTRISSGYTLRRKHPVLKVVRPHQGIDYAAPLGTPIKSVGDGVVSAMGYDRAAGRFVKIRHKNGYETIYNHMSKFARKLRKGLKVKQGQVIGYVGKTGYATGPHLDFRVKRYGKYLNPLTLKSPSVAPIPKEELTSYFSYISSFKASLDSFWAKK